MSDAPHIVCPHCDTINRIPATRLGEAPKCGHCHQALFTGQPLELTQNNFRRHVDRNLAWSRIADPQTLTVDAR